MARILYVNQVSVIGGAERSLLDVIERIDRSRFTPFLACPPDGALPERARDLGVRVERCAVARIKRRAGALGRISDIVRLAGAVLQLTRIIRKRRIDIVHANGSVAQIHACAAAALGRVPAIWHVRDLVPLGGVGTALYRWSAGIIVPSEAVRVDIERYRPARGGDARAIVSASNGDATNGAPSKVVRIYNGIDTRRSGNDGSDRAAASAAAAARERYGIDRESRPVGMIAHLVPWKDHRCFIEAARAVVERVPEAVFIIVGEDLLGDNPLYRNELQDLSRRLGVERHVRFTGLVDEVEPLLRALDLVALPSRREPFGRVLIEAMAAGKAVVAADDGGPAEIVENGITGILVPPSDPAALAGAISSLLIDDARREEMGRAGAKRVRERFDIEDTVRDIEALYAAMTGADRRCV
jgi:glycosyltransferase involved in cell wall biosynthesis